MSQVTTTVTVREVAGRFASSLKGEERQVQLQELNKFVRDFDQFDIARLTAEIVEKYQEGQERSGADSRRLEPIKSFLAFAHKHGFTDINYGKFIRIRRANGRGSARGGSAERVEKPQHELLTAEGFKRLQEELDTLINVKRPEIARDLFEARIDKDFRENAPFDAAKQHQAEVEARIRQLQAILARAEIIDEGRRIADRIVLGVRVTIRDIVEDDVIEYTLVSPNEANPREGRISVASPVGRAVMDRRQGDEIEVDAPAGKVRYRIESVVS